MNKEEIKKRILELNKIRFYNKLMIYQEVELLKLRELLEKCVK